jgi:hypothetical protein
VNIAELTAHWLKCEVHAIKAASHPHLWLQEVGPLWIAVATVDKFMEH